MDVSDPVVPPPVGVKTTKRVVVIGGGVTGCLAAWELARSGHQVTLVEAGALGNGASSRSAACIRAQFDTPSTVKGMIYCERFFRSWQQIMETTVCPISCNGYLFLYSFFNPNHNREQLIKRVAMQQQAGLENVRWLEPKDLAAEFPYIMTAGLIGASFCNTDGFIQPAMIYNDSAEAAQALGAKIMQNRPVIGARFSRTGIEAIRIAGKEGEEEIEADVFVNATNAWANPVSAMLGGRPLDIAVRKRYLFFLEGLRGKDGVNGLTGELFARMPFTITPNNAYCRPESVDPKAQLMFAWLHNAQSVLDPTFEDQDELEPFLWPGDDRHFPDYLLREIASYVPDAGESMGKIRKPSTGYYDDSPDHNPFIGFDLRQANLIQAAGFSGHGLMHAPFSARIIAELVAAGKDLETIQLPELGEVDTSVYRLGREYRHGEGMVI